MSHQSIAARDELGRFVKKQATSAGASSSPVRDNLKIGKTPDLASDSPYNDRSVNAAEMFERSKQEASDGGLIVVFAAIIFVLAICLVWAYRL